MTGRAFSTSVGRARLALTVGLIGLTVASWAYLAFLATKMHDMSSVFAMPMTPSWTATQAGLMVLMWAVMMAGMMLPSALPMVVTYDTMSRGSAGERGSTWAFIAGYLTIWAAFAAGATALQWVLHELALVDGMGSASGGVLAAVLLVGAGIYQLTPLKRRSLGTCRTPMGFLMTSWRDGRNGAFVMGLHHGVSCLRCCAALMLLMFVLGVMNLLWAIVLTIFVVAEKVLPRGETIATAGGLVLLTWGLASLALTL